MNAIQDQNDNAFWLGLLGAFCVYFIPWFIALVRGRDDSIAIFVVNFVVGWTGLGWVVALFWSLTKPAARSPDASERETPIGPSPKENPRTGEV